jgi:hypothetical protein
VHLFTSSGLWLEGLFHALSYQHRTCIGVTHICHSSCSPIWHWHIFSCFVFFFGVLSSFLSPFFYYKLCARNNNSCFFWQQNEMSLFLCLLHCFDKSQDWRRVTRKKVVMTVSTNPPPILFLYFTIGSPIKFSMCSHQVPILFPPCSHNLCLQGWTLITSIGTSSKGKKYFYNFWFWECNLLKKEKQWCQETLEEGDWSQAMLGAQTRGAIPHWSSAL